MFTRCVCAGALAVPLLWMFDRPALAQESDKSEEEELAELENAMAEDAATLEEQRPAPQRTTGSLNPDISLVLDTAFAVFSEDDPPQTGGHDPTDTGFTIQQLELDLSKPVDPYFRLDAFIVFNPEGVEIEEAFGTTLALPASLQVRAGQFLTRFGRINNQHLHAWDFVDQPFFIGRVLGGEGQRGIGAEVSWLTPLPWYVELVVSTTNSVELALGGHDHEAEGEEMEEVHIDDLDDFQHVAAVEQFFELSDDLSLLWGVSAGYTQDELLLGTDVYLKYRPITRASHTVIALQAEAIARRREVAGETFTDRGGYGQLTWKFARRWGVGARYEFGSKDELDPDTGLARHRAALQTTFWPTEYSRVRLQGGYDYPRWLDDPIASAMLAVEYIIGSHGAHKF